MVSHDPQGVVMPVRPDPLQRLGKDLGYRFRNPDLLREALTHRSAGSHNNERLEFLGDGVLNFVIAAALYERRPRDPEGDLSRLRATLVRGETLAVVARRLQLGEYLTLGPGELKSGGQRRDSILADALEAILGAIYLDGGFDLCRDCILALWDDMLKNLPDPQQLKDPKTRLQEFLQSRGRPLPGYEVVEVTGEAHAQTFIVHCRLEGVERPVEGVGGSRRKAEQAAAEAALKIIEQK